MLFAESSPARFARKADDEIAVYLEAQLLANSP